jgi:hypothetical protein
VEEIKIVFLGDVFDLLRTEMWFGDPAPDTPWGGKEPGIETQANLIFSAIVGKNRDTFDLLGGSLHKEFPDLPCEPERIYMPGNHDRLCNKYGSLRRRVRKALRIAGPEPDEPFEHLFRDADYGVIARHGHEFDNLNYEGGPGYSYDDYMKVPIGDPLTTELVAKLPWTVMRAPEVINLPVKEQQALRRNLQDIENVRPFSATIEWLLYQVQKNPELKEVIESSVDQVIQQFNALPFVRAWYRRHDKWTDAMDEADQMQLALYLLEKFKVFSSEKLMPLIEKLKDLMSKDELLEAAAREYAGLDSRIRYVAYGHTHDPLQVPIRVVETPPGATEYVYLNTGTWCARYYKAKEGLGFVKWKNLTYSVFYKAGERGTNFPVYETWTGTLK